MIPNDSLKGSPNIKQNLHCYSGVVATSSVQVMEHNEMILLLLNELKVKSVFRNYVYLCYTSCKLCCLYSSLIKQSNYDCMGPYLYLKYSNLCDKKPISESYLISSYKADPVLRSH